ncbi:MAG: hypothetical protein IIT39_17330 [Clostridia bacterium]|nr:hypothetical protein [Clostridia bacterium]
MRNSKIVKVLMSSALVASVAVASAMSTAAISNLSQLKDHFVGVTGSFNNWDVTDVELTDADGDGIYEGIVDIPEVTEEMIGDWKVDDVLQPEKYLTFKVRLDKSWDDSWGAYEPENNRTYNSQSNVPVKEAVVGQPLKFNVIFDTTKINQGYIDNKEQSDVLPDDPVDMENIGVTYKIIETVVESSPEPSQPSESSVESSVQSSVQSSVVVASQSSTDTSTVPTGDATSAAALAAIVVASLGVAVVMTKKASAK